MKLKKYSFVVLLSTILVSCNSIAESNNNKSKINEKALEIYNKAALLSLKSNKNLEGYSNTQLDSIRLEAIKLCDQAIKIETNYNFAYRLKAKLLIELKMYKELIPLSDTMSIKLTYTNPMPLSKGFCFLKLKTKKEADSVFQLGLNEYLEYKKHSSDKKIISNIFSFYIVLNQDSKADEFLKQELDKKNLSNEEYNELKELAVYFKEMINSENLEF